MPDSLADVLATEVSFDLCNGIYSLLLAHYGEGFNPAELPAEQRHVLLVWHTHRIIGNKGFNGFFADDQLNDPDYRHLRAAYEAISCEPAAVAVRRVFDAFPERTVPADARLRVQAFGKANQVAHGALNRDFTKAQGALTAAVAKYIRDHADAFDGIDAPGKPKDPVVPGLTPGGPDPIEDGIGDLPKWAQVAFNARCARQIFPLWEEAWPDAPAEYHDYVEQAIVLAEMSASEAEPVGGLKGAATQVAEVVEAAVTSTTAAFPQRAGLIAAAAGSVVDFISGAGDYSATYVFVKGVIADADRDDLMEDIQEDFQRIEQHASEGGWNEKTPVPTDVFDPNFKPKKGWWKRW